MPLVDAAIREMKTSGFMSNRATLADGFWERFGESDGVFL